MERGFSLEKTRVGNHWSTEWYMNTWMEEIECIKQMLKILKSPFKELKFSVNIQIKGT